MQFHQDGFRPGDPGIALPADGADQRPDVVDVLIVGCGPAGLTLAAQLSAFPDIVTRIVEQKPGPLEIGQADGVACRSMEMFAAFGFADRVAREAYWVNETTFWRPGPDGSGLARADRIQDVEDDLSEMPHVILSQARIHDFFLDVMERSPRRLRPDYGLRLLGVESTDHPTHPVVATLERVDEGKPDDTDIGRSPERSTETIRASYVVGCDGARSTVRRSLGQELRGEAARQLWGVMDVLAVTDFPDIRLKTAIQSADQGSLLIIPREGGRMVRMYIELDELRGEERAGDRAVSPEILTDKAEAILAPYHLDVREVAWWSAYEIGQRLCDAFDDVSDTDAADGPDGPDCPGGPATARRTPRIFIAGDACHTHSPKAGQGMNVSMADAFNLGWKLAAVIRGQADPALLHTYSEERRAKAKELIDFDRDMARLFSQKPETEAEAATFQRYFQKHGRYTAGVETRYDPTIITTDGSDQRLATGLVVGMRFHSAPVIRLADAKPMQLGHVLEADGRWRLIAFAPTGDRGQAAAPVAELCRRLTDDPIGPLRRFTPPGSDVDAVIDVRAVFQAGHRDLSVETMPDLLLPTTGRLGLTDYQKIFCPDHKNGPDIFDHRGIDRNDGALVIVRPDQFVAGVLPLVDWETLSSFFDRFMSPTHEASNPS